ncbi:hypothetical protein M2453_000217 [Aequitasia blattaphilus]
MIKSNKIKLQLLLVFIVIIMVWLISNQNQKPNIDSSIQDYVAELKRPENLEETKILIPAITNMVMDADSDVLSGTTLFNPAGNPCYFQFTIVLEDGITIFESQLVPPGKGISEAKLNRIIKEGTYDVIIRITSYDLNDHENEFNGGEIKSVLRALG